MAGRLSIRNVDDVLITRLKRPAARHGRSAEAGMRDILRQLTAATQTQTPSQMLQRENGEGACHRCHSRHQMETPARDRKV